MANKHMRNCSIPLVVREMQVIKTTRDTTTQAPGWLKLKSLTPNVGEEVKQLDLMYCWRV